MSKLAALLLTATIATAQDQSILRYDGGEGPGSGRRIVLIAGDEEYRSEEALPMLARILAVHHGFDCEVLFHTNPESGAIDPGELAHVQGAERIDGADLVVLGLRFRRWSDEDMRHLVDYVAAGRPVFGIRTSTHAFRYPRDDQSEFASWSFDREGGFGRQVLGETWVAHHGGHGREGTRGVIALEHSAHPMLRGVSDVFGPTDVYTVRELPEDATVLLRGAVVDGITPDAKPVSGPKNEPMMPVFWIRERARSGGNPMRVACSTIGAADDLASEDLRRLFVNACYWCVGLEDAIPERARVDTIGRYEPSHFGFGKHVPGVMPGELALPGIPPRGGK